jgi:hypothetical protein
MCLNELEDALGVPQRFLLAGCPVVLAQRIDGKAVAVEDPPALGGLTVIVWNPSRAGCACLFRLMYPPCGCGPVVLPKAGIWAILTRLYYGLPQLIRIRVDRGSVSHVA